MNIRIPLDFILPLSVQKVAVGGMRQPIKNV